MATRERVAQRPAATQPAAAPREAAYAPEGASKHLPPLEYRDIPPAPRSMWKVVGPSVVLVGVGISSGEFIIWPYITSQVGLIFLWAAAAGIFMQYILNTEIERYTLATGETAIVGFARSWKPWGLVFVACAVIPNFWPGWATSSATLTSFLFGGGNVTLIAIVMLVVMGAALTLSPVVYKTMERIEFAKVGVVLVFLVIALTAAISGSAYSDVPKAVTDAGWPSGVDVAVVLGALAFAGAGGVNNLCQSNWIRDKGFGMGAHIPHIVSPVTGEDQAKPSTGYMVGQDEENLRRFSGWWKVAKKEQFIFFFLTGLVAILVFSLLAYSTVHGRDLGEQLDFVEGQGNVIKDVVGPWFGTLFWAIGAVSLFAGSLGILDYVGRVSADVIKTIHGRESRRWTESKLYFAFVWGMVALSTIVLLSGFDQPLALLVVSSSLSGVVMFIYSMLLIRLNRRGLPPPLRVGGLRLALLCVISAVFGVLSVWLLLAQL
jgi:hypothetical protein